MKKLVSFFAIALFLSIPLAANATMLGTGDMTLYYSTPIGGGYYLDYDGKVTASNFGYTTPLVEIFCVSDQPLTSGKFEFYTITDDLDTLIEPDTFAKLSRAAWVADHWTTWGTSDYMKGEAQKAVWKIMDFNDFVGLDGEDLAMYNASSAGSGVANYNWYFAKDNQDYLTPVPEPGILILLGIAMSAIGMASRWVGKI